MKWLLKELLKLAENEIEFQVDKINPTTIKISLILFGDKIIDKTITI